MNRKMPIIVSFVTKNTPYENTVKEFLIPSLEKYNLKYYIDYIENRGSWAENVCYKPEFLYKMLNKYKEPIVSCDVDAIIEKYPSLFEELPVDIDIAAHILDWQTWYKKGNKKELLGGTLYLNYNDKVLQLLKEWITIQKIEKRFPQRILYQLLESFKDINFYELPLSYCYIATLPNGKEPFVKIEPIISQWQKSREFKRRRFRNE